jgi:hypothetical protein
VSCSIRASARNRTASLNFRGWANPTLTRAVNRAVEADRHGIDRTALPASGIVRTDYAAVGPGMLQPAHPMRPCERLAALTFARGASAVLSVLDELAAATGKAECLLRDARDLPVPEASVDAVIASPPYINVFNYHQNYRPATELLGWRPLEAARSEIGANRKHRANRFLTVIQYCLDMWACLKELSRVMRADSPLVLFLGELRMYSVRHSKMARLCAV